MLFLLDSQMLLRLMLKLLICTVHRVLCRQLGYVRGLDEKVIDTEDSLVHTPIIGMHVIVELLHSN